MNQNSIDFGINSVACKIHQRNFIDVDAKTFGIICKICLNKTGKGSENLFIEKQNKLQNDENKDIKHCYKHLNDEALFYCDDCSHFICKNCFATDHRAHNSSTFELTVKNVKQSLKNTVNDLNSLKKSVDENLQSMQEINNYFSSQKNTFKNTVKDTNERILASLNLKAKEFSEEIESIFNGIDFEVENSSQRLENTKRKAVKMLNEFQTLYKEVESISSDKKVCLFKKEKDGVLNENIKFLTDLQFFLTQNLEKTKEKSIKEMENFSKKCTKFQKNAEIYENSVINTIVSGIPNICMRVRRFRKFFFNNTKYFKTNSICMLTSHTINLVGFSICGLFNNKNNTANSSSPSVLKINLKIYEMESVGKFDSSLPTLCSTEIDIPVIFNVIDPVYQFYLKNAITVHKDRVYYILMTNLSDNNYVDLWSGEVSKDKDDVSENQHSVLCNNSNVKFNFVNAVGVESDFNEFTGGILSDVIFSHID